MIEVFHSPGKFPEVHETENENANLMKIDVNTKKGRAQIGLKYQ